MNHMLYDYIIVGAGPAGLYTARRLEDKYRKPIRILIIEKDTCIGGRTRQVRFHSHLVATGAGVGRYQKDKLLMKSLRDVMPDYPIRPFHSSIYHHEPSPVDTLSYITELKKQKSWIRGHRSTHNFKDCFLNFYSKTEYRQFCRSNGFTDFEDADIVDTLYDYGFEDNQSNIQIFNMPWNKWMRGLRRSLMHTTLLFRHEMISCHKSTDMIFQITTKNGSLFHAKTIVYAGSLEPYPYSEIKRGIGIQPFVRMYAFLKEKDTDHLKKGTYYVENELQKFIVLTPRIRMISYSDNQHARKVMNKSIKELETLNHVSIQDLSIFYRKCGTHFYYPLDTIRFKNRLSFINYAQHPEPNVFLVGEVISKNQGWTEGALESVERIMPFL